jgi:exodeoxyribonuclease VII large subunit
LRNSSLVPEPADDFFATRPSPPTARETHVHTVTEITRAVRGLIESAFEEVWVQGEVSNLRQQSSGHQYFTLKDAESQISCVLFARGGMWRKSVPLQDGMLVQAKGRLTVYEARGQYQLVVSMVQAAGAGILQARFEALKRKLAAEGLFEAGRKRPLPKFPRALGIITSPTGAALRDMLNILSRRAPWLRVIISPARMQGEGAAAEIIASLADLQRLAESGRAPVDVIVLARGGGSMEDLWEFNDEQLARAIAASRLPVVSAVGHEIDFTIADFVADLRAPTPSAAAELVAPDTDEMLRLLAQRTAFFRRHAGAALESARAQLAGLARSALFREPQQRVLQAVQRLDAAEQALARTAVAQVSLFRQRIASAESALRHHRPDQQLVLLRERLAGVSARLTERARRQIQRHREVTAHVAEKLRLLSPKSTLKRGYSLTTDETGALIRSVKGLAEGATLVTEMADGKVESIVRRVRKGKPPSAQRPAPGA